MKDSIENSGEKQCDGNPVDLILSHPELGEGARILLYWLWRLCGGRPNRILTNKHHLASSRPSDVARKFGVSVSKVLAWIRRGELRALNLAENQAGKKPRYRILPEDLEKFEARRAVSPTPPASRKSKADLVYKYF